MKNMLVRMTVISRLLDFVLHPEVYIICVIIIHFETEVETRKPVGQSDYFVVQ